MNYLILSIFLCAAVAIGSSQPDWNGFRVTWSKVANPWAFIKMPRYLSELPDKFILRDNQCEPNSKFLGRRYWNVTDPSVILLFDIQGTIAGIQTSIDKTTFTPPGPLQNTKFIDDGGYWTLTTYFVDPNTICRGGRSKTQLTDQGTGTTLYLQQGPNPLTNSVLVPYTEDEVKKTSWTPGGCVPTMGQHYWYNVTKGASCDHFVPDCILYNKGKLTAFCFFANANLASPRYEHSTNATAGGSIIPLPDCFNTNPTYQQMSTMHVYMIDDPKTSLC